MIERQFEAVVFDAYGTLLDVHAAMAHHAEHLGNNWQALATEWHTKQLEYSWIDSMTVHRTRRDFAACTADALDYVLVRPTPSTADYARHCSPHTNASTRTLKSQRCWPRCVDMGFAWLSSRTGRRRCS